MSARMLAAGVIAALTLSTAARAADLYGENYVPPADDYAYEAPRDVDRGPPPGAYEDRCDDDDCDRSDRYAERPDDRGPPDDYRGSVKDGYARPVPPPLARYAGRYDGPCVPRWQIRHRLRSEGWTDLRPLDRTGPVTVIRARRAESGRSFTLRVDRCSGEIVEARPLYLREFGAYEPRPLRRGRY